MGIFGSCVKMIDIKRSTTDFREKFLLVAHQLEHAIWIDTIFRVYIIQLNLVATSVII